MGYRRRCSYINRAIAASLKLRSRSRWPKFNRPMPKIVKPKAARTTPTVSMRRWPPVWAPSTSMQSTQRWKKSPAHAPAADALQHPEDDRHAEVWRQAADQGTVGAQHHAHHVIAFADEDAAQPRPQRQHHRVRQQVAGQHPRRFVLAGGEPHDDPEVGDCARRCPKAAQECFGCGCGDSEIKSR